MRNTQSTQTHRSMRLCVSLLLAMTTALMLPAQPTSTPPPPPPNFIPPSPPSGPPPSRPTIQENTPEPNQRLTPAREARRENISSPIVPVEELPEQPNSIVDLNDPKMKDTVGLIRIPDLGTNDALTMLEELSSKSILRQQSLPTVKLTFYSQGELTRAQAIRALESLLALNGIALTTVGNDFIKAVPAALINTQVPLIWEGSTLKATPTQMIYEKIFSLDFLNTAEAISLVQPLMSQGVPIAFDKSSKILITDSLVNLQRIERILGIIDTPSTDKQEILLFQLKNVDSQSVLRRLQQIQNGPLRRRLENNTSFDADERTNQIFIFTHPSNKDLITDLVTKMDVDVKPITTTKVFSIRYAEAAEVVSIIDQVITGQKQARDQQSSRNSNRAAQQAQQAQAVARQNQAAAAVRAEASNLQFSDFTTLVADERANNIVASGTPADIDGLTQLIDQIDVLLAQVRIEAIIVQVELSDSDSTGIDALGFNYNQANETTIPAETNSDGDITTPARTEPGGKFYEIPAFSIGGIGIDGITWDNNGQFSIGALLKAVQSNSRSEILSAPTIVTTHNREAKIVVGESRPIITASSSSSTNSDFISSQVQYRDIGIELTVTPLIGSDGIIQLEIEQAIEDIGENVVIDGNNQPTIITRQASSFVSVGDGQLVVLGGLQRVESKNSNSYFPFLGRIPLLNKIFTGTSKSEARREIILFIRPKIIRTAAEADQLTRDQLRVMESAERAESYLREGTFRMNKEEDANESESFPNETAPRPGKFSK